MEEMNHFDAIELKERDIDASRRSRITNSTDPHSAAGVAARHEAGSSVSAGPHFLTLFGNGAAPNAPDRTWWFLPKPYQYPSVMLDAWLIYSIRRLWRFFPKVQDCSNALGMALVPTRQSPSLLCTSIAGQRTSSLHHSVTPPTKRVWPPCWAYRAHPHLIDQLVLTSFIEGLKSSILR